MLQYYPPFSIQKIHSLVLSDDLNHQCPCVVPTETRRRSNKSRLDKQIVPLHINHRKCGRLLDCNTCNMDLEEKQNCNTYNNFIGLLYAGSLLLYQSQRQLKWMGVRPPQCQTWKWRWTLLCSDSSLLRTEDSRRDVWYQSVRKKMS